VRQTRYKEALSYLAHSLKTPLAVLRCALGQPDQLPDDRGTAGKPHGPHRAAPAGPRRASGAARFAPRLTLAPVVGRVRDSHWPRYMRPSNWITLDCPPGLAWRIDEGDAFELLGNLMDNAAKWATKRVRCDLWREATAPAHQRRRRRPWLYRHCPPCCKLHVRMDEKVPGHGVGLAVVNDLVASHEGTLTLGVSAWGGAQVDVVLPAA
jgi:two-component system sensor histidine kinase PhoQ